MTNIFEYSDVFATHVWGISTLEKKPSEKSTLKKKEIAEKTNVANFKSFLTS